jgi:hypothetical protein
MQVMDFVALILVLQCMVSLRHAGPHSFSGLAASGMCPKETSLQRRILLVSPLQNHKKWTIQSSSSPKKTEAYAEAILFPEFAEK